MAIDVQKHIDYWRNGSREDAAAAAALLDSGHIRHALFFAHLSLEKAIKAAVCQRTRELPPRIHSLTVLAERSGLPLEEDTLDWLSEIDRFNLAGRYPDALTPEPTEAEARLILKHSSEVLTWVNSRFCP